MSQFEVFVENLQEALVFAPYGNEHSVEIKYWCEFRTCGQPESCLRRATVFFMEEITTYGTRFKRKNVSCVCAYHFSLLPVRRFSTANFRNVVTNDLLPSFNIHVTKIIHK